MRTDELERYKSFCLRVRKSAWYLVWPVNLAKTEKLLHHLDAHAGAVRPLGVRSSKSAINWIAEERSKLHLWPKRWHGTVA